jgi:hypothetical protein
VLAGLVADAVGDSENRDHEDGQQEQRGSVVRELAAEAHDSSRRARAGEDHEAENK